MGDKVGATAGLEMAPGAARRYALERRAEERRWARRNGPVRVMRFDRHGDLQSYVRAKYDQSVARPMAAAAVDAA